MIRVTARSATRVPKLITFRPVLPAFMYGSIISLRNRPSRKSVRRRGASKKSSALRVGGVSITISSHRPSSCSSHSFSIAMYSCVPASVEEMWW